jgi:catechol 2,3-dioxygenase-like lactoylglutathione lyase family enzyme
MGVDEFRFHHGGISVENLDASIDWYSEMLGFRLIRRYTLASIPAEIAILKNGSLHIELLHRADAVASLCPLGSPDEELLNHGIKHVAFAVEHLRPFIESLREKGVDVVWLKELPGGRAASFIRDNEGNLIEFVQTPFERDEVARLSGSSAQSTEDSSKGS